MTEKDQLKSVTGFPGLIYRLSLSQIVRPDSDPENPEYDIVLSESGEFIQEEESQSALTANLLNILFTHLCQVHGIDYDDDQQE